MKCVAEARDGRTKDVQGAHLKIISHFQDPSGRGWRPVNLSQIHQISLGEPWQSWGEMRLHDFWSEGLRTAENACRVHSLAPELPYSRCFCCLPCFPAALLIECVLNANDVRLCWTPCKCSEPSWPLSPFLLDSFSSPLTCVLFTWQISVSKAEWSLGCCMAWLPSNLCLFIALFSLHHGLVTLNLSIQVHDLRCFRDQSMGRVSNTLSSFSAIL